MSSTCSVLGVDKWLLPLFGSHEIATSNVQLEEEVELNLSKHRITLLLEALCILAILFVLLRGILNRMGVYGDDVVYMSTARNLLAGNGFVIYDGSPFIRFAPMFPMLLAFIGIFGFDPLDVAGIVNVTLVGLTIFVSYFWLRYHLLAGSGAQRCAPSGPGLLIWAVAALILAPFTRSLIIRCA